jgi:S-adenosylmethionine hydrolase
MTALPGTSGTVPTTNTAQILNTKEIVNIKNITHQVPSGANWDTTFVDASTITYLESMRDLVG